MVALTGNTTYGTLRETKHKESRHIMWVVNGKTSKGKDVEYKVSTGKDTDKAFVLALAFQQHGAVDAEDPLTAEAAVRWTSDNIKKLPQPVKLYERGNYGVDRRIGKGLWERHTPRAFRSMEAAEEAMESAASEYPDEKFRIVATVSTSEVVAISKNAVDIVSEEPDKPQEEDAEASTEEAKGEAPAEAPKPSRARKPAADKAA
jgi:hypothetical protein